MEHGDPTEFFSNCDDRCKKSGPLSDEEFKAKYFSPFVGRFKFQQPPEAPVFHPTEEEFKDPLLYISRIRPLAEQTGICKIVPPNNWVPPFTLEVNKFKFVPRVQQLNKIEATTRIKLNFLERIKKFWQLQGSHFKTPWVERHTLDLYSLHRTVQLEGGYGNVTSKKKWVRISSRMGFLEGRNMGLVLKSHYERILLPYDLFMEREKQLNPSIGTGQENDKVEVKEEPQPHCSNTTEPKKPSTSKTNEEASAEPPTLNPVKKEETPEVEPQPHCSKMNICDNKPAQEVKRTTETGNSTKSDSVDSKAEVQEESEIIEIDDIDTDDKDIEAIEGSENSERLEDSEDYEPSDEYQPTEDSESEYSEQELDTIEARVPSNEKELRRLQFQGAGPKMAVPNADANANDDGSTAPKKKKKGDSKPVKKICRICKRSDVDEPLVRCYRCHSFFHLSCLPIPMPACSSGRWCCCRCISKELNRKPDEAFGFEQAQKEYTLNDFGVMADRFKNAYFRMPVGTTQLPVVEEEFWRITQLLEQDITVEYGADIHAINQGSGFPTPEVLPRYTGDDYEYIKEYCDHPWNLNNLPVCAGSVFRHVDADISGMKVPWMYIGMCFSTFCWHNEDHWSYSVNYLHWGEPKTWYGVPGARATDFEAAMKRAAPELFDAQPDLLHQLVTLINPNVLMNDGVPVYRLDQNPGEFVITFPRAYHAGFNHGYNCAEAVNFAPPDWIKMGRDCLEHYALTKRYCVFSHDELIFKIASIHKVVDLRLCAAAFQDLRVQSAQEKIDRLKVLQWGVSKSQQKLFELIPDDERQCEYCKTTIFSSGVTCFCRPGLMVCIKHYDKMCSRCTPDRHVLMYRHKFDEIIPLYKILMDKVKPYEDWVRNVRTMLRSSGGPGGLGIAELRAQIQIAEINSYPNCDLLQNLLDVIQEAEEMEDISERIESAATRRRLVVFGREIALDNYDAWVYFIYYFEHTLDYRCYMTSPLNVFRICTCDKYKNNN